MWFNYCLRHMWSPNLQNTGIQEDFWHIFSGLGCTVTLGCSRRLDHLVIKMEQLPSFSQPNDRENQPLDVLRSHLHYDTYWSITPFWGRHFFKVAYNFSHSASRSKWNFCSCNLWLHQSWFPQPEATSITWMRSHLIEDYIPIILSSYHFDSDDDFCSGCRNVSHCHRQQSFSGLPSPGRSHYTIDHFVMLRNQIASSHLYSR